MATFAERNASALTELIDFYAEMSDRVGELRVAIALGNEALIADTVDRIASVMDRKAARHDQWRKELEAWWIDR